MGNKLQRAVLWGAADKRIPGFSWMVCGQIARQAGRFELGLKAPSWGYAAAMLAIRADMAGKPWDMVQLWSHGVPGHPYMGGDKYTAREDKEALRMIGNVMNPKGTVWFRSCAVFSGSVGHDFAQRAAGLLGCRVAGHTFNIGPWQSGLHTLAPGDQPKWSTVEGNRDGTPLWSAPWEPNTITALQWTIPRGW